MQQLRPHHAAAAVLERFHTENYENPVVWPYDLTLLSISMSGTLDQRMNTLAAIAILSQDPLTRDTILATYSVPYPIREAVEAGTFEPIDPLPVKTFGDEIDLTESVERTMMERRVDIERDRRINGEFTFNDVSYQSRPEDRENLNGAATSALAAIINGAQEDDLRWHGGTEDFVWIAADNSTVSMDAQTMFALGQSAMVHKQNHIFAARALKDAETIPEDYVEDQYWPGYVAPEVDPESPEE